MTTQTPNRPPKAPPVYTAKEASRQDSNRLSGEIAFIVPILFVAALYSAIFFLPSLFPRFLAAGIYGKIALLVVFLIILAAPFILGYVGFKIIFTVTEKYTKSFFDLPEDVKVGGLIEKRLFGLPSESPFAANLSGSFIVISDEKLGEKFSWVHSFGGPSKLVIMDGYAVYSERGGKFSRVIGSGIGFLDRYETIREIIDLRPQIKELAIDCWTKDGIKLKVHIHLECQILSAENSTASRVGLTPESDKRIYPFYEKAVKAAVETAAVRMPEGKPEKYDWVAGVCGNIEGQIRTHTFSNTINDLLRTEAVEQTVAELPSGASNGKEATRLFSPELKDLILGKVNNEIGRLGARLINLQIVRVEKDPLIDEQWRENWSAEWKSLNTVTEGEAKANNIRTKEKAHADAEKDMILAIAESLENLDTQEIREHLILSLSGMLESSLVDPYVRATLPKETIETLEKLQNFLK